LLIRYRQLLSGVEIAVRPYEKLKPVLRFRLDGANDKLWTSVPNSARGSVVVLGGYLGDSTVAWSNRIPEGSIHVFEPVPAFADTLAARFSQDSRVAVHPYGLARDPSMRNFLVSGDASSQQGVRSEAESEAFPFIEVEFKGVSEVFQSAPLNCAIAVMEVNIEGGEYELIPLLHDVGVLPRIEHLFVQFHDIGPLTRKAMNQCHQCLSETHDCIWSYDLVWEYWRVRHGTPDTIIGK